MWSAFWHSDQLQSCVPAAAAARQELQDSWRLFFEGLEDGARILDLGTGNGSVTTEAARVSAGRPLRFDIHGVDSADIDPPRYVSSAAQLLRQVKFHPRTSMEALPFDDASFDAVTSQYAIEYSRIDASLIEAMRVLRPGGRFRILMHADDGVLKTRCREQRRQAETVLQSPLFARVADLLEKVVTAESGKAPQAVEAAMQAISALQAVFAELDDTLVTDGDRGMIDNLFAAVRQLPAMRHSHDLNSLLAMSADIEKLLMAQAGRLQAMEEAALDESAAAGLRQRLRALGARDTSLARATAGEGHCVGFWLTGSKSVQAQP